ncbi:MAG: 5-formyltetrahydrofolate cyclo-ligase [Chitinispirillales bacterium]|jgi:5-formyltetrahydrofolate cyclo-ligase|nr:5-formyltetrahydrofolate cyclo-ligase [Chitinispirillales bacterium]
MSYNSEFRIQNSKLIAKKRELRAFYTGLRKGLGERMREKKSADITAHILSLPAVADCDMIMAYRNIGSEVDTFDLMSGILASGRGLALPYCRETGGMGAAQVWNLNEDIEAGPFGTVEPKSKLKGNIDVERIGVCICPGVAFDMYGTRLGRGRAFYDNFLSGIKGRAKLIGCAFDCQVSDHPLPKESHDAAMDLMVTESGVLTVKSIQPQNINIFAGQD